MIRNERPNHDLHASSRPHARFVLALLLPLTAACGGDDAHVIEVAPMGCLVPSGCDITQTSCQNSVLEITACVRGESAPPLPPVRMITMDQFRDELVMETMDDSPAEVATLNAALIALHLLPAGGDSVAASVDVQAGSVVAYYDDKTGMITIIEGERHEDLQTNMYELSHELTHYLQFRQVDAKSFRDHFDAKLDGQQAERSLLEGEAVVNSLRVLALLAGHSPDELDWAKVTASLEDTLSTSILTSATPFAEALTDLPYLLGTRYIADVWNNHDRAHVDALFDEAPRTTVDWTASYNGGPTNTSLVERLSCAPPLPPAGYVVSTLDRFGETGLFALMAAAGGPLEHALEVALRGDAIAVYTQADASSDAPVLTAWRLRFTTPALAQNFVSAMDSLHLSPHVFDREVLISVSSDPDTKSFDSDALTACPSEDDLQAHVVDSDMNTALLKQLLPPSAAEHARWRTRFRATSVTAP